VNRATLLLAALAFAGAGAAASAAPRLKPVMKTWKSDAATAQAMLTGAAAYDEAEMRRILSAYAADADGIASRLDGSSAAAKEFSPRFAKFAADACWRNSCASRRP
jgi:hypothetical protein